ncbi:hypothetical protein [Promicromonospora iranensis]|uniref:Uncharacterized protein n=1 Tax=Promicromonospora iranensis TaxID=1105144 RepID=A0ABU2CIN5_9MICO|nr:hypothetical protein [Promicromonospora iranensis]MDR7381189.1 hypothetical protein [Promicromonospora iranensis]
MDFPRLRGHRDAQRLQQVNERGGHRAASGLYCSARQGDEQKPGSQRPGAAAAARALETITTNQETARQLGRPGPRRSMERVPVVLADARARAAQLGRDADERARRDAAGRASEQVGGWGW